MLLTSCSSEPHRAQTYRIHKLLSAGFGYVSSPSLAGRSPILPTIAVHMVKGEECGGGFTAAGALGPVGVEHFRADARAVALAGYSGFLSVCSGPPRFGRLDAVSVIVAPLTLRLLRLAEVSLPPGGFVSAFVEGWVTLGDVCARAAAKASAAFFDAVRPVAKWRAALLARQCERRDAWSPSHALTIAILDVVTL